MNSKTEVTDMQLEECPAKLAEAARKEIASGGKVLSVQQRETRCETGYSYRSYQVYLENGNMYIEIHYPEDTKMLDVNYMMAGAIFEIIKHGGPLVEMVAREALQAREKENPFATEQQTETKEKI